MADHEGDRLGFGLADRLAQRLADFAAVQELVGSLMDDDGELVRRIQARPDSDPAATGHAVCALGQVLVVERDAAGRDQGADALQVVPGAPLTRAGSGSSCPSVCDTSNTYTPRNRRIGRACFAGSAADSSSLGGILIGAMMSPSRPS